MVLEKGDGLMRNLPDKIIAFSAAMEFFVLIAIVIFIFLYFIGCSAPRNSVYCYDNYKSKYTKCPSGYKPGMEFNSRGR